MPYIPPEIVAKAREMDVLTYLRNYEPSELIRFSGETYTTKSHDSLKISNGKWCWFSEGIGGKSALDYLIKVRGFSFMEAVEQIVGRTEAREPVYVAKLSEVKPKDLLLPPRHENNRRVEAYLKSRGIDKELIQFCIDTGRIYESKPYHNVVFVGFDENEKPRYANLRGIGTDFRGDANGSDKHYSFGISANEDKSKLHVFESAIDLLSFASIKKYEGEEWNSYNLLSLAGVYQPRKVIEESTLPAAITQYLKNQNQIKEVVLCLDNDRAGQLATKAIQTVMSKEYNVSVAPPPRGKDYNDYLCMKLGLPTTKMNERNYER
ncbi:hypothetical protein M2150_001795 [Lachnospiraceae bacterium PM6-15]|uniref:DUF3991 domain-containing protein n=1 Tax=Ohessyouella blattaphilus TaxID=2949333 RepID=UPI003E1B4869